jgi:hypothetical protein
MDSILAWADKYFHLFSIIGSLSFTVAALSFLSSAISTKQSVKAHDFKTISDITTDIFAAWQTIRDNTDPDKRAYLVAELLNKYERACFL